MRSITRSLVVCYIVLACGLLASCSKKEAGAPGGPNGAVYDSTEKAEPVNITDAQHYIYFRPKVGDTYRYHISLNSTAMAQTDDHIFGQYPKDENAVNINHYYLRQTVRDIRKDSSIEFSVVFDSILIKIDKDTIHLNFSSNNPASKDDPRFRSFAGLVGEQLVCIVDKHGLIKEISGTSNLIAKYMKQFPDSANTAENRDQIRKSVESSIADYLSHTMVLFPNKPMAKDSTLTESKDMNFPIWQQVMFPMHLDSKTVLEGFQERGGKVLANFVTTSTLKPLRTQLEDPSLTATLVNPQMNIRESALVEDATGMLVHREVRDERSWDFGIQNKKEQDKYFKTKRSSRDITTVDLLR